MVSNEPNRLRWKCRRGTLELDKILNDYLEHRYPSLTLAQQKKFSDLLNTPDPTLWAWLMGDEVPEDKALFECVKHIQQHILGNL